MNELANPLDDLKWSKAFGITQRFDNGEETRPAVKFKELERNGSRYYQFCLCLRAHRNKVHPTPREMREFL